MNIRVNGCLVSFVIVSMFASATSFASGWSGIQKLDSLQVTGIGGIMVVGVTGDWNNPDGCDDSSVIAIAPENKFFNRLYAATLTSYATTGDVRFFLNGCVAVNGRLVPKIRQVQVFSP
jgi:hypothetical protein